MSSIKAYVMVSVKLGKISSVIEELEKVEELDAVHVITGDYDVIAIITADEPSEIKQIVTDKIHTVNGVEDSTTYVALKEVDE